MIRSVVLKALAGTALLTLGLGTAASAATPTPAAAPTGKDCKHADVRVDHLQQREVKLDAHLDVLRHRDAEAKANHHEDRAQRIEHRIDGLQKVRATVADRIAKIRERCPAPPAS
ncbi:MAG: hypothetical protein NVSMB12_07080 [Acidimicrobiales bacterium]